MIYVDLAAGLIYLLMGGDLLVRGAVALARRARISPMVVAASVVAFGTSVPELVVSAQATLRGFPGMALGNVVGSNVANVLLVGGSAAAVFPLVCDRGPVRRDSVIMVAISFLFITLFLLTEVTRPFGALLLATLVVVYGVTAKEAIEAYQDAEQGTPLDWVLGLPSSAGMATLLIVVGTAMLPLGADLIVDSAAELASRFGVSDVVIGLTLVALGTSLPELATTVVASFQRRTDVALGTIIGSNVFNLLGIMGVAAMVSPTPIVAPPEMATLDFPVMGGAAVLLAVFAWRGKTVTRIPGALMIVGYAAYIVMVFMGG